MFVWNVQVLLNYIKSKWGCTSTLSDKKNLERYAYYLAFTVLFTFLWPIQFTLP